MGRSKVFQQPEAEVFLNKNKPSYMGGILQMANHRLYRLHLARLVKVLSNTTGGAGNHPNFCHR
ncbi:MAG: hypothetical protein ICV79_12040 [Flavisolibacter sp.]|nr:hypothetical protein [Flavisolibacter sp.]